MFSVLFSLLFVVALFIAIPIVTIQNARIEYVQELDRNGYITTFEITYKGGKTRIEHVTVGTQRWRMLYNYAHDIEDDHLF